MSIESSSSLIREETIEAELFNEVLLTNNYSVACKIAISTNGSSSLVTPSAAFYTLIPKCLFYSFQQVYLFYFIFQAAFQYLKNCDGGDIITASIEIFVLVLCIVLQIYCKYLTYQSYTKDYHWEVNERFMRWNFEEEEWEEIEYKDLRAGQVIKVLNYVEQNTMCPVNLLPINVSSNKKEIQIKTARVDKREQLLKVSLIKSLRNSIDPFQQKPNNSLLNVAIDYVFISDIGENFEGIVTIMNERISISNEDVIPAGIPITTEEYVIGVTLLSTGYRSKLDVDHIFSRSNDVNSKLSKYLVRSLILNVCMGGFIFVANIILTFKETREFDGSVVLYLGCWALNICANLMKIVHISIYFFTYIHRILDANTVSLKTKFQLKNFTKSVDQFGQIDTLVMDDYFFMDKSFPDNFQYIINEEVLTEQDLPIILRVIDLSKLLNEHMHGHVVPICKFFRIKKLKSYIQRKIKVKIIKESFLNQNTIEVKISVIIHEKQNRYIVKFTDRPVYSALQKINDNKMKREIQKAMEAHSNEQRMILFIEILKLQEMGIDSDRLDVSNQLFQLYSVVHFDLQMKENDYSLNLIKDANIYNRHNLIIMTSKSWKYFEAFMVKAQVKKEGDAVIILEEKEEHEMIAIVKNHIQMINKQSSKKKLVLCLNSNMITYLSRKFLRFGIKQLCSHCKYIIFYNCSQYEKELCAASIFKIFPMHIFMSNYQCDYNIFQWSHLSVCERGASSESYSTAVITKYNFLGRVILKEALISIQLTSLIINNSIFKNQLLLASNILAFFLLNQGSSNQIDLPYVMPYFFYNFVFTSVPLLYYIVARPEIYINEFSVMYLKVNSLMWLNFKAILLGILLTFICFALLQDELANNLYLSILINCIIISNIFYLYLDDSFNKKAQALVVVLQIVLSLLLILLLQNFNFGGFQFLVIDSIVTTQNTWFFLTSILICPIVSITFLFAYSAGSQYDNNEKKLKFTERSDFEAELLKSEEESEIVVKVSKRLGKQMRFREEAEM